MPRAAPAHDLVPVVLGHYCPRLGQVADLVGVHDTQVPRLLQPGPARAAAPREQVPGLAGVLLPGQEHPRRAGLLARLALAAPAPGLRPRLLLPRQVIRGRRHGRVPAIAVQSALKTGDLLPQRGDLVRLLAERTAQLADQLILRRDPLIPGSTRTAVRRRIGQNGHKP